jgi:hypothetical protein
MKKQKSFAIFPKPDKVQVNWLLSDQNADCLAILCIRDFRGENK